MSQQEESQHFHSIAWEGYTWKSETESRKRCQSWYSQKSTYHRVKKALVTIREILGRNLESWRTGSWLGRLMSSSAQPWTTDISAWWKYHIYRMIKLWSTSSMAFQGYRVKWKGSYLSPWISCPWYSSYKRLRWLVKMIICMSEPPSDCALVSL